MNADGKIAAEQTRMHAFKMRYRLFFESARDGVRRDISRQALHAGDAVAQSARVAG